MPILMPILSSPSVAARVRRPLVAPRRRSAPRVRSLAQETARLRAHFREVLGDLLARPLTHLSAPQRATRRRLIDELARYARAGRFPRNLDFPGVRTPYFVDAFGTRCAMAHLIATTGAEDLVARVAAAKNNALVGELAADPALQAWLEEAGLTVAEAARIQPSYCFINKADACFCEGGASNAVVEVTVTATGATGKVTTKVDVVHGDAAAVMVGQQVDVFATPKPAVGDALLVSVSTNASTMMPSFGNGHRIASDGTVGLTCSLELPKLKKADAIAALLAPGGEAGSSTSACSTSLAKVDATWGESQCEDGSGCSLGGGGAGSPLMLGTLVLAALGWRRRRALRRGRARG